VTANNTAPSADATHWQIFNSGGSDIDTWFRQPNTQYGNGAIALLPTLPTGWYLECTGTGGTTSASDLVITSPAVGNTVTDGTVVWTIRKMGAADLSSCANIDLSNLSATGEAKFNSKANADLDNLSAAGEAKIANIQLISDFTIIYPGGGTTPPTVSLNQRYVDSNPFPGYYVACMVEIYYNNKWGFPGNMNGGETVASQFDDDTIVTQTSTGGASYGDSASGCSPWGTANNKYINSVPCRVKVWKIGKIPTA
jgi:hypothetical protein